MSDPTVQLVSTDPALVEALGPVVEGIDDLRLETVSRVEDALARASRQEPVVILAHVREDGGAALRLLRALAAQGAATATVVLSDRPDDEEGRFLVGQGAADYLSRPFDLERVRLLIDRLTLRARYAARKSRASEPAPPPAGPEHAAEYEPFAGVGASDADRFRQQLRRVIPLDTTVLLGGETGTGKTRLARLIHELSPRSRQPFLVVNCGAMSPTLIESEMFGHVKGAFTGADRDRTGKFADVGRGTLFLDEVDSLPVELQAKLLRAVDERVFEPVGSNRSLPLEARLIAASNRRLDQEVAAGRFRSDLYYRLNVVGFHLPPLHERRDQIRPLVAKFVQEFAGQTGRPVFGVSGPALDALQQYDWPGNVRELRNVIHRAVVLCPGDVIQVEDLPDAVQTKAARGPAPQAPSPPAAPATSLMAVTEEAEIARIVEALRRNGNNRLRAANELGISRMTLYKKMRKYGLMNGEQEASPEAAV
jgi:two-component system response regulator AtoC